MNPTPKSLLQRLVTTTVILVLLAIGLTFAWHILRPMVPALIVMAVVIVVWRAFWTIRRRRNQW